MINLAANQLINNLDDYQPAIQQEVELRRQLDKLALIFIHRAIYLIHTKNKSEHFLVNDLNFIEPYTKLVHHYLNLLSSKDLIQADSEYLFLEHPPEDNEIKQLCQTCMNDFPNNQQEINVIQRCGFNLPVVLEGKQSFISVLFEDGDIAAVEVFYRNSTIAKTYNQAVAQIVKALSQNNRHILEVGAGAGGTTEFILPELKSDINYTFTDISKAFLVRAKRKFKDYPSLNYAILDINKVSTDEKLNNSEYDIIVCCNVIHVAKNLSSTLDYLRQFLSNNGILILLEMVKPDIWVDIVFGPTEGWWSFEDYSERGNYPLLSEQQWIALLEKSSYQNAQTLSPLKPFNVDSLSILIAEKGN